MLGRSVGLLLCCVVANLAVLFAAPPKLVVVISLDQFPYEYLVRFRNHFGEGGFRLLLEHGANFTNATYKHALNTTGPGHAAILSGSYGNQNGIIANTWYDITSSQDVICVRDANVKTVGGNGAGASPAHFIGSTFGDELRIQSSFRSRVISLSAKDRAAILLGGKLANEVFWMADSSFVTSTYYANALPEWVRAFNSSGLVNSFFGRRWEYELPDQEYLAVGEDDVPYENGGNGLGRTFPHTVTGTNASRITPSYYEALLASPFGNQILAAFAREAIRDEKLGSRGTTDLLCISFSSNDYVGHAFGPNSHEVMDMTVRTDRLLEDLLGFIELEVGLSNCVIVLTSDHGVTPIPEYILAHAPHADAGRMPGDSIASFCNSSLTRAYGSLKGRNAWVKRVVGNSIYLDRDALREKKLSADAVAGVVADSLMNMREVAAAITRQHLFDAVPGSPIEQKMRRSLYPQRSGDVLYALKPYFLGAGGSSGTTHGQPYDYDAHVPLIIAGEGVRSGSYATEASPADIGPTLCSLLGIEFPAGREGRVLVEALKFP